MHPRLGILTAVSLILLSCAVITVNIYFPEKEVKSALKSLEEEFLKEQPSEKPQKPLEEKPKSEGKIGPSPIMVAGTAFVIVQDAWAQPFDARRIAEEIKTYPEVVQAFQRRGGRLVQVNQLKDRGLVGEGRDGRLVVRGQLTPQETATVSAENQDREVIIQGIAKAILKINKMPSDPATLAQITPQAAEQFAGLRRDEAKPGWWIQRPDGSWVQK